MCSTELLIIFVTNFQSRIIPMEYNDKTYMKTLRWHQLATQQITTPVHIAVVPVFVVLN